MWSFKTELNFDIFLRHSFQTLSLRTGRKGFFFSFCWLCAISSRKQKSGRDMMTLSILCCLAKAAFINFKSMEILKPMGDTHCIPAMIQPKLWNQVTFSSLTLEKIMTGWVLWCSKVQISNNGRLCINSQFTVYKSELCYIITPNHQRKSPEF